MKAKTYYYIESFGGVLTMKAVVDAYGDYALEMAETPSEAVDRYVNLVNCGMKEQFRVINENMDRLAKANNLIKRAKELL